MRKLPVVLLPFLLLASVALANNRLITPLQQAEPRVTLQKMWVDFDVYENGLLGMRMHAAITVHNMKGMDGLMGFYFKYSDGDPNSYVRHPGVVNKYHDTEGGLAVSVLVVPADNITVYEDLEAFIPYDEFRMSPGEYDLTIDARYYNKTTKSWVAFLKLYDIVYSVPDESRSAQQQKKKALQKPLAESGPRAVLDSLWVERDVQEQNQLGLRLHFRFTTYQMKDTAASVAVYFLYNKKELEPLKDKNNTYATASGNVATYLDITPGYDTAYYNNLTLFMPYSELHLAPGNHELLMDSKLIYRRGGLISNFLFYGFRFTQQ